MKALSKDKKIKNTILAAMLWHTVSARSVALHDWTCGTQACFGGHLASWPEFAAQGVGRRSTSYTCEFTGKPGAPCIHRGFDEIEDFDVARHLFGTADMFSSRGTSVFDQKFGGALGDRKLNGRYKISDHKLVANRLNAQFAALTS